MTHTKAHRDDKRGTIEHEGEQVEVWLHNASQRADREYDVKPTVWRLCHGTGKQVREGQDWMPKWKCSGCDCYFDDDETGGIKAKIAARIAPPHAVRLTIERDLDERLGKVVELLGLDYHEAIDAYASLRRDIYQKSPAEALAGAVQGLATILTKQAATKAVVKAITDFDKVKIGDEFCGWPEGTDSYREHDGYDERDDMDAPFFTEGFLYNLLGKEAARTVLAHWGRIKRAAGKG